MVSETTTSIRHREQLEDLALQHGIKRLTFDEVAKDTGVSARTLKRWAKDPEYQRMIFDLRERWRNDADTLLIEAGQRAVSKMIELMETGRAGGLVQYYAAKALIDAIGLGKTQTTEVQDDRVELQKIYELQLQRAQEIAPQPMINLPPGSTITIPRQNLQLQPYGEVIDGESRVVD